MKTVDTARSPQSGDRAGTRKVDVDLENRSYSISIGPDLITRAPSLLSDCFARRKTVIVTDENLAHHYGDTLTALFREDGFECAMIALKPGEPTKSFTILAELCDRLLAAGVERSDTIIALGGGVIGDLAGFAAAVLRRGIRFVQIPTSLLAQVDSSVGGKTGINSKHGKNLIGAFHQPIAVLADTGVLETLPPREFRAGYAEVAKYGLLGDSGFFTWLESNWRAVFDGDTQTRIHMVETCCAAKAGIVAQDEREAGIRALLNLGHTFGHALEASTGYSDRLLHGEGVSIGMVLAFRLSEDLNYCPQGTTQRVETHLRKVGLPTGLSEVPGALPDAAGLLDIMRQDKKAQAGEIKLILAHDIGEAFHTGDVAHEQILQFLTKQLSAR